MIVLLHNRSVSLKLRHGYAHHALMEPLWDKVDEYFAEHLSPPDAILDAALAASTAAGLPAISVTPSQGKLLQLLAQLRGARRILEVGTLAGYSTIWMGRALPPDGELITLEIDPTHAAVARENLERAGLSDRVEVRVAPAAESLAKLVTDRVQPFDLVFIDADKASIDSYFVAALGLSRAGTVIVVDNVARKGEVIDAKSADASVQGVRRLVDLLSRDRRVSATAIQTVGSKGYDGLIIAVVSAVPSAGRPTSGNRP
jgi:predicted O-methyltransferase YrrM